VNRIIGRIAHNWPLKLAAVGLAVVLYGGLALSENTQTYPGAIPVTLVNEPENTVLLPLTPPPVTLIRYFAPSGVSVGASTFSATIDMSNLAGTVGVVSVPISVRSPDARVRVLSFDPAFATLELDRLDTKADVPVKVDHGPVPDGLTLGPTVVDPPTVTVSGAASILAKVDSVRADVIIQSTGIDVAADVQLIPIDKLGNALSPLDVTPASARVTIPVFSDRQSRTLPINPIITGTPAAGFEIGSVTVQPQVALVAGDADQLAQLTVVDTDPIPMTGVSSDETVQVNLALPSGVVAVGEGTFSVTITVKPVTETRTFTAGLRLIGASTDLTYALSVDRVLVTIGGSTADLDRLSGSSIVMDLSVTGLRPGPHDVAVTANLPTGTTLVAASPPKVTVTIGTAPAGTSAPASAAPAPSGGG
jgi:YbbR domain-containing protein